MLEPTEINEIEVKIENLASQLHDEWRQPRYREETKDFEPRVKGTKDELWSLAHDGKKEVDIANTDYRDLPSDWQAENKVSAQVALEALDLPGVRMPGQEEHRYDPDAMGFDIERASAYVHEKWLERNGAWAPAEQNKPYEKLSEEEKQKDRIIVEKAIELWKKERGA